MKEINKFFEYGSKSLAGPKNLVVLLHGYGSNGEDLISLAHDFAGILKDTHFIAPNAPMELINPYYKAYQWFEILNRDPQVIYPQIIAANNILDNFIKAQLERFNLGYENLILMGFSQGAMMSLYNSLRQKDKIAGVVAFSGKLISPIDLGEKIQSKPPLCLIHGDLDDVVTFDNFLEAKENLAKMEFDFEAHEIKNLGHSINLVAVKKAKDFLSKIIK